MRAAWLSLLFVSASIFACGAGAGDAPTAPTEDAGSTASDAPLARPDASPTNERDAAPVTPDAAPHAPVPPTVLGTTDGGVATGWYCGKNAALMSHVATWNAPALRDPNNLFYVDAKTKDVRVVGYCSLGCRAGAGAHDACTAPSGTPIDGKECFGGAGTYCGHVLGIEARSFPIAPDREGLFTCDATAGVSLAADCDCEVNPGAADACVPAAGGRKLYIAYETAQTCVPELTDFWRCLFDKTDFTARALAYGTGYKVEWGGIAEVPASCGEDHQCAVSAAHFPARELDVVLIVKAGGIGGQNNWDTVVTVGGKAVHIHGAYIGDAAGNCDMQSAYAMHEVYEATSDPGSGDCCDGEVPYTPAGASGCLAWNSAASIACAKWGPASCGGDGSYGLARLQCGAKSYLYQRISPADDEYGKKRNECLPLAVHP